MYYNQYKCKLEYIERMLKKKKKDRIGSSRDQLIMLSSVRTLHMDYPTEDCP